MVNQGITELRFWVIDNKSVHPSTPGSKEVIVLPGGEISVELSPEQRAFYKKSGHLRNDAHPVD